MCAVTSWLSVAAMEFVSSTSVQVKLDLLSPTLCVSSSNQKTVHYLVKKASSPELLSK